VQLRQRLESTREELEFRPRLHVIGPGSVDDAVTIQKNDRSHDRSRPFAFLYEAVSSFRGEPISDPRLGRPACQFGRLALTDSPNSTSFKTTPSIQALAFCSCFCTRRWDDRSWRPVRTT
jgi:hypothetical protein